MDEEERKKEKKKKKTMDDGIARYFIRLGENLFNLLTCGKRSLVSGTQNDTAVS